MAEDNDAPRIIAAKNEPLLGPKEERESQTARLLALISLAVLILGWGTHYLLTAYLGIHHPEIIQSLTQTFSMGFSVFSSLAGTAFGFYLKEKK